MHPIAKSRLASGVEMPDKRRVHQNAIARRPSPADRPPRACTTRARARRLRRRLRRPHQGRRVAHDRQPGAAAADQPAAPRRVRVRGQHRRRRRHPDSDAGPVPAQGGRPRWAITLPPERGYGAGLVFLPRDPAVREQVEALFEQIVIEEGQLVLGWRDVPTDDCATSARAPWRSSRCSGSCSSAARPGLPAPGASLEGDAQLRAQALRDPQADRARHRRGRHSRPPRSASSTSSACRRTR